MVQTDKNTRTTLRVPWKHLAQVAIAFVTYFVAGKLGQATTNVRSGNLGPVWPAYGIALAAVLIYGYRVWVGIAAAAFLVALLSPVPGVVAVGQAFGATVAALTGGFLLFRIAKFQSSLSRLRDALALIVLGALGSALVSASIGVSVLYVNHVQAYQGLGSAWLIYWLGDSTGVLLVTPLVLTFPNLLKMRSRARILNFAGLILFLTLACFIIFGDLPLIPIKLHVLAFAVLPFVIWAAIRFGVSGAALSTLLVATIATVETALGSGPFAQNTPLTNAVLLDVFFAVLSVSGMTLSAAIAEREQAERERELLIREQAGMEVRLRLATIVESSDDAIIGQGMDGTITDWNRGAERLYGYAAGEVIGKPLALIVPDRSGSSAESLGALRSDNPVTHYEAVCERKNGTRIEVSLTVSPIRDAQGRVVGSSVIGRDITERKVAEQTLLSVNRRLIEAQEQERTRIARELHDDIGQRLALLTVELEHLKRTSPELPVEVRTRIGELQKQTSDIGTDTQSLSHELHSSKLEYLGVAAAARSFCREFGEQQKVEIDVQTHDLPGALPPEASLCLFRVLQEALHNSAKHSGVRHFEVQLWGTLEEIHLTVKDSGVGFDREAAKTTRGLGLISMEERLKLVNGTLSIESQPQRGTTIHARVPLTSGSGSMRAAS
jgi:PAS domain S-box-containing protein